MHHCGVRIVHLSGYCIRFINLFFLLVLMAHACKVLDLLLDHVKGSFSLFLSVRLHLLSLTPGADIQTIASLAVNSLVYSLDNLLVFATLVGTRVRVVIGKF